MNGNFQSVLPLMRVHVFPVVVHKQPSRSAFAQHAEKFAQGGWGIGPIVGRFDGDGAGEEIGVPGNLFRFPHDEHRIFEARVIAPCAANHLVGNVDTDDAPLRQLLGNQPGQPARAATEVENIVLGSKAHAVQHGQSNRQVILLHALAAALFGPAVELLPKRFGMRPGIRGSFHLPAIVCVCSARSGYIFPSSADGP